MLRSLRTKMLLGAVLLALVASGVVGLFASRATRNEFHRFLAAETGQGELRQRRLAEARRSVLEHVRDEGSWQGVDTVLRRLAGDDAEGTVLLLLDREGAMVGASDPGYAAADVEATPDGGLVIRRAVRRHGTVAAEVEMFRGSGAAVVDEGGRELGMLHAIPRSEMESIALQRGFIHSIDRRLLGAATAAVLLVVGLTWLLARRILGPVERLTRAARAMARGELDRRVQVASGDEIGELAAAFNGMAEALERHEALRRNMVADIAHELRTPLTSMRCQIEAAQDGLLHARREFVDSLHEDVLSLQHLVHDLQELALADAGQLQMRARRLDVAAEIRRAVKTARAGRAGAARIDVQIAAVPDVVADPERLGQVLRNLLANALTHTPRDGRIAVCAMPQDGALRIEVRDTGPGIPAEHLPHVFERFYRVDPARRRSTGGAGLGLAICRHLVEAWRGRIWVESEPGRGTTMTFTVPVDGAAGEDSAAVA